MAATEGLISLIYQIPGTVKFINAESKIEVTRCRDEGAMVSYYLMGTEFLFREVKKFWR